ncbi:hypothetical protein QBC39DRAFT_130387 [Podospora conica]|nr:hypothetical protein QBC39DRAFT_130387 [Schizothecium conicum]
MRAGRLSDAEERSVPTSITRAACTKQPHRQHPCARRAIHDECRTAFARPWLAPAGRPGVRLVARMFIGVGDVVGWLPDEAGEAGLGEKRYTRGQERWDRPSDRPYVPSVRHVRESESASHHHHHHHHLLLLLSPTTSSQHQRLPASTPGAQQTSRALARDLSCALCRVLRPAYMVPLTAPVAPTLCNPPQHITLASVSQSG